MPRFLLRAPDHLGDGVLALPAMGALCRAGPSRIVGPRWAEPLYAHLPQAPVDQPDVAVLFKPAFRAAWDARAIPRRVGVRWDLRGPLLTDPVERPAGHRLDEYAALAGAVGVPVEGLPALPSGAGDAPPLPARAALLLPLSASGATVEWAGFRALADRLAASGLTPVFCAGPGQDRRLAEIAGPHRALPALALGAVAAAAAHSVVVVGNDSGLTHLAAAARRGAGRPVEDVHVICGSTAPDRTAAPGATAHVRSPPPSCWPCYRKRCAVGRLCLDQPVSGVAASVLSVAGLTA